MSMYTTYHTTTGIGPVIQVHHNAIEPALEHARHVLRTYSRAESVVIAGNYGPYGGLTMTVRRGSKTAGQWLADRLAAGPDELSMKDEATHE